MENLRILIWLPDNDAESLNQTLSVLDSRYGIERFDIVGVVGEDEVTFQGKKLNNISLESVPKVSFDYVIVGTSVSDSLIPAHVIQKRKKALAEQIGTSSESIVFDFEIYHKCFSFPKVCLVIIFNHRYDKNLPLLRKIYGKRFSEIRFLMPFYDGSDADVIPVYESSYQFQGFLIQAYEKLKNIPCTHYLFVADDLILHPDLNETNFATQTNIQNKKFLSQNSLYLIPRTVSNGIGQQVLQSRFMIELLNGKAPSILMMRQWLSSRIFSVWNIRKSTIKIFSAIQTNLVIPYLVVGTTPKSIPRL
ncbi:MAG: hypothetical protein II968_01940 [Selenomonadaceae bacterium]|nr:hypothetical protein [Selenomonadaceae bacterium]